MIKFYRKTNCLVEHVTSSVVEMRDLLLTSRKKPVPSAVEVKTERFVFPVQTGIYESMYN